MVHVGPANTRVRSSTLMSDKGGEIPVAATESVLAPRMSARCEQRMSICVVLTVGCGAERQRDRVSGVCRVIDVGRPSGTCLSLPPVMPPRL